MQGYGLSNNKTRIFTVEMTIARLHGIRVELENKSIEMSGNNNARMYFFVFLCYFVK